MAGNKPDEETENGSAVEEIDVFIKHPLHNSWTYWFLETNRKKSWDESLREIATFSTVEDFWSLYNHMKAPSELKIGTDLSVFKRGIRPMWEDTANQVGGRWALTIDKKQRDIDVDSCWLEMLLLMIGEYFGDVADEVNGMTVSVRGKNDKVAIWMANAHNTEAVMAVGRKMKERLGLSPRQTIHFQRHDDSQSKLGSTAKSTFTL